MAASAGRPIRRLLIANRGEIAVRIARTAHRLGISTVGVHGDGDVDALHVDVVDRSVHLGGATPAESYLRVDAVVAAALATGCDAVHPGYGFLAERADAARAARDAGLVWVGPTPEQIDLLGDKVAAKRAAVEAGVPTTPVVEVHDPTSPPEGVTFPALVKAAAGGGGRGMRVVERPDDLAEALLAASREAQAAFGDGTVFVEPYLARGRHVEVQVLGDAHGNVVHLGERECSIQRRNQKVVEEAPSAGIDGLTRARLHDGAVALARAVGYVGAGTVEFLVSDDGGGPDGGATITFLEVNTRLQVEHPVTEAVTGLDLVELQLRVAAGEPLPIAQDDVVVDGHAIEVRVVAEDPAAGWLPSTGTLTAVDLAPTEAGAPVRVDAGYRAGDVVSADFDSLLAKVVAHAPTRSGAAATLARALRASVVTGVRTDLTCLVAVLGERDFLAAETTTAYLDEHPEVVAAPTVDDADRLVHLLAAVVADERRARAGDARWGFAPSGWRNLRTQGQRARWVDERDQASAVEVLACDGPDGTFHRVLVGDPPAPGDDGALGPDERAAVDVVVRSQRDEGDGSVRLALELDGVRHVLHVAEQATAHPVEPTAPGTTRVVRGRSGATSWRPLPRFPDHAATAVGSGPVSPLPGTVLAVHVAVGDAVADGQVLVVVEAMKMEHAIAAPADALVAEVLVAPGDRVDAGDLLVRLDAPAEPTADDGAAG